MDKIYINGKIVTPTEFEEQSRREDILLHQVAPSIYITLTKADIINNPYLSKGNEEKLHKLFKDTLLSYKIPVSSPVEEMSNLKGMVDPPPLEQTLAAMDEAMENLKEGVVSDPIKKKAKKEKSQ
jgi:hypothetical protein